MVGVDVLVKDCIATHWDTGIKLGQELAWASDCFGCLKSVLGLRCWTFVAYIVRASFPQSSKFLSCSKE